MKLKLNGTIITKGDPPTKPSRPGGRVSLTVTKEDGNTVVLPHGIPDLRMIDNEDYVHHLMIDRKYSDDHTFRIAFRRFFIAGFYNNPMFMINNMKEFGFKRNRYYFGEGIEEIINKYKNNSDSDSIDLCYKCLECVKDCKCHFALTDSPQQFSGSNVWLKLEPNDNGDYKLTDIKISDKDELEYQNLEWIASLFLLLTRNNDGINVVVNCRYNNKWNSGFDIDEMDSNDKRTKQMLQFKYGAGEKKEIPEMMTGRQDCWKNLPGHHANFGFNVHSNAHSFKSGDRVEHNIDDSFVQPITLQQFATKLSMATRAGHYRIKLELNTGFIHVVEVIYGFCLDEKEAKENGYLLSTELMFHHDIPSLIKERVGKSITSSYLVGFDPEADLKMEYFDSLTTKANLTLGNVYQTAIADHDLRVVNNYIANIKYTDIVTSQPTRELRNGECTSISKLLVATTQETVHDPDSKFLLDVALAYSYNNVDRSSVTVKDELLTIINHQNWFEGNTGKDYIITKDPCKEDFESSNFVLIIAPKISNDREGKINGSVGWFKWEHDKVIYNIGNTSICDEIGWWRHLCCGAIYENIDDLDITVVARKSLDAVQVIMATKLKYNKMITNVANEISIELPVIDQNHMFNAIPVFRTEKAIINEDLLNKLLTKNLTGKVSDDNLMEYGMALSWFSYSRRGVELSNVKITPERVKYHVYLAKILQAREQINDTLLRSIANNTLSKAALAMASSVFKVVVEHHDITEHENLIKQLVETFFSPIMRAKNGAALRDLMSLNVKQLGQNLTEIEVYQGDECIHHDLCTCEYKNYNCECCGSLSCDQEGVYCDCCLNGGFDCPHECKNEHTGNNICKCCNKNIEEVCYCCTMRLKPIELSENKVNENENKNKPTQQPFKTVPTKSSTIKAPQIENVKITLDKHYTEAEMSALLSQNVVALALNKIPQGTLVRQCRDNKKSMIPFINMGETRLDINNYTISDLKDVTQTDCGVDCCKWYAGLLYSDSLLRQATVRTKGLNSKDIHKFINILDENCIIVDVLGMHVTRVNDTDEFCVIIHGSSGMFEADETNHWQVCKLALKQVPENFCGYNMGTTTEHENMCRSLYNLNYNDLDNYSKLQISTDLAKSKQVKDIKNELSLSLSNNVFMNNKAKVNDLQKGKFAFKIKDKYLKIIENLITSLKTFEPTPKQDLVYNVSVKDIVNIDVNMTVMLTDFVQQVSEFLSEPGLKGMKHNMEIMSQSGKKYIDLNEKKIKNGDLILLLQGSRLTPTFVQLQSGRMTIDSRIKLQRLTIYVPKFSFMSNIMKIYKLMSINFSEKDLAEVIQLPQSRVVSGYGGSGKTTMIVNWLKTTKLTPVILASTTGGVISYQNKDATLQNVMSKEKWTYLEPRPKHDVLIIDEATLVPAWELCLLMDRGIPVIIMGDLTQIGSIDYSVISGSRYNMDLLTYGLKISNNITNLTNTYRIGNPLCREISRHPRMEMMETNAKHKTNLFLFDCNEWDSNKIMRMIGDYKVILCFYNNHVSLLSSLYRNDKRRILTVHAMQGEEANDVVVIQAPLKGSTANTHLNFNQCIAAATRCKENLKWISVACYRNEDKLNVRLGVSIGVNLPEINSQHKKNSSMDELKFRIKDLNTSGKFKDFLKPSDIVANRKDKSFNIPPPPPLPDLSILTPKTIKTRNVDQEEISVNITDSDGEMEVMNILEKMEDNIDHKCFNGDHFNAMINKHASFISSNINKLPNDEIVITLSCFGLKATIIIHNDNTITMEGVPREHESKVHDLIIKSCKIGKLYGESTGETYKLNDIGRYRIRILCFWTRSRQISNRSTKLLNDLQGWHTKMEDRCCNACGPLLLINKNKETVTIMKDYMNSDSRLIKGKYAEQVSEVLNQDNTWNILPSKFDDKHLSHIILTERIFTWFKDVPENVLTHKSVMHYEEYNNKRLEIELERKMGKTFSIPKVDNANYYVFYKTLSLTTKPMVSYVNEEGDRLYVNKHIDHKQFDDLIYSSLLTMEKHIRKHKFSLLIGKNLMKKIGANDEDKLTGMVETFQWHKEQKTEAYFKMANHLGKRVVSQLKYQPKIIYVPNEVATRIRDLTEMTRPFQGSNEITMADVSIQSMDLVSIMLMNNTYQHVHAYVSTCYAGYAVNYNKQVTVCNFKNDRESTIESKVNQPLFERMLYQHAGHLPFDSEQFTLIKEHLDNKSSFNSFSEDNVCLCNPFVFSFDVNELKSVFQKHTKIYAWGTPYIEQIRRSFYMTIPQSTRAFRIHDDQLNSLLSGLNIKNTGYKWQIKSIRKSLIIYELTDKQLWVEPSMMSERNVTILTPRILLDPEEILRTKDIFSTVKVTYNMYAVSNLTRRLLKPGTTYDDLLVQARTLLNSTQFNTHVTSSRYGMTPYEAKNAARLAFYIHNYENYKYSFLDSKTSFFSLEKTLLQLITKFMPTIIPTVNGREFESLLANIDMDVTFKKIFTNFLNNLDKLTISNFNQNKTVVKGNFTLNWDVRKNEVIKIPKIKEHIKLFSNRLKCLYNKDCDECNNNTDFRYVAEKLFKNITRPQTLNNNFSVIKTSKCRHKTPNDITLSHFDDQEETDMTWSFLHDNQPTSHFIDYNALDSIEVNDPTEQQKQKYILSNKYFVNSSIVISNVNWWNKLIMKEAVNCKFYFKDEIDIDRFETKNSNEYYNIEGNKLFNDPIVDDENYTTLENEDRNFFGNLIKSQDIYTKVHLPWDVEVLKEGDQLKEVWNNALISNNKLKPGRDLLAINNTHFVANDFKKGARLRQYHIEFLERLYNKAREIDRMSSDKTVIHLYSLKENRIERSPEICNSNLKHLHINLGTSCEKFDKLGFHSILTTDPKRFGASLRVIFAMMLNTYHSINLCSGRPGLHVIATEKIRSEYQNEDENLNTVFLPFATYGPFIDGMTIRNKFNKENINKFLKSNMNYYSIYGIDECDEEIFDINKYYQFQGCMSPYSNWIFNSNYSEIIGSKIKQEIEWLQRYEHIIPLKFVNLSASDSEVAGPYIKYWDKNCIGNSRSTNVTWNKEIEEFVNQMNNKRNQILDNLDLPVVSNKLKLKHARLSTGKFAITNIVYDPLYASGCIESCVFKSLNELFNTNDVQWNNLIKILGIPKFGNIDDIETTMQILGLNYRLIDVFDDCKEIIMSESKIFNFKIKRNLDGTEHCLLVDGEYKEEKIMCMTEEVQPVNDDEASIIFDKFNADPLTEQNVEMRWFGALKHVLMRRKSIFPTTKINKVFTNKNGKVSFRVIQNGISGGLYAVRQANGWVPRICHKINSETMLADWFSPTTVCVFLGTVDNKFTEERSFKEKRNINDQLGFLSLGHKQDVEREFPGYSSIPVNQDAKVVVLYNFDNVNHHGRAFKSNIDARNVDEVLIPLKTKEEKTLIKKKLELKGPIRPQLMEGNLEVNVVMDTRYENILLENWINNDCIVSNDVLYNCFDDIQWETVGNRYTLPNLNEIIDENFTIERHHLPYSKYSTIDNIEQALSVSLEQWSSNKQEEVHVKFDNYYHNKPAIELLLDDDGSCTIHNVNKWLSVNINRTGFGKSNADGEKELITLDDINDSEFFKHKYWKFIKQTDEFVPTTSQMNTIISINSLNDVLIRETNAPLQLITGDHKNNILIIGNESITNPINGEVIEETTAPHIMNYWDDETAMVDNVVELPKNDIKLRSNEMFLKYKDQIKGVYRQYPYSSQPAYTKRYLSGLQATSDLYGGKLTLRQVKRNPKEDAEKFAKIYFTKNSLNELEEVNIDYKSILEWLKERPDRMKIAAELEEMWENGLLLEGLEKVNVHKKLESRMRDVLYEAFDTRMPNTIEEQRVRLIAWQKKGISCVFASFFAQIKEHFKRCLKPNIIYTDGMSPRKLSNLLNNYRGENVTFVEDDLAKQDRQTDKILIDTEMEIYKLLRGNNSIIDLWHTVHKNWRAKGMNLVFEGTELRFTGQCTTSLGNSIVNLLDHMLLVERQGDNFILMLFLGDDNLMVIKGWITEDEVKLNSARHFNMVSSPVITKYGGIFLRMLVYMNKDGNLEIGPDILRLRRRFEVTNGVSELTEENTKARVMSYLAMLGSNTVTDEVVAKKNLPVKLEKWYDYSTLIMSLARKYRTSHDNIEGSLMALVKMMLMDKPIEIKKIIPIS